MSGTQQKGKQGSMSAAMEARFIALLPFFSLFYIWQSTLVSEPPRSISVGPRTIPLVIGWLLLVVSLVLVWQKRRQTMALRLAEGPESDSPDDDNQISDWPAVWTVLGAFLGLILLLETLGFIVAIALFVFGVSTLFAQKQWLLNLVSAVGLGLAFYLLFTRVLGIQLPPGVLGSLL